MTTRMRKLRSLRPVLRVCVVLCCLLSFTSSFNLTVLADILDRNLPVGQKRGSVAEITEDIDEDADLYPTSSLGVDGRRGERKPPPTGNLFLTGESVSSWLHLHDTASPSAACRAGSEHALRNGLGGPLLC
jgi:hypothetical protein